MQYIIPLGTASNANVTGSNVLSVTVSVVHSVKASDSPTVV